MKDIRDLVEHTNARLIDWYENAKGSYGVIGHGYSKFNSETNELEIYYTEDGVDCFFSHGFFDGYELDTIFNIWAEYANVENDRIQK